MSKRDAVYVVDFMAVRLASLVTDVEHLIEQNERMEQRLREVQAERDAWVIAFSTFATDTGEHARPHEMAARIKGLLDGKERKEAEWVVNQLREAARLASNPAFETVEKVVQFLHNRADFITAGGAR